MRRDVVLATLILPAAAAALDPGQPARTHSVGGELRVGLLRGEPRDLASDAGFGFAVNAQWFYRPGLGLRADATFDRFGGLRDTKRQLSFFGFDLLPILVAYPLGRWLPWGAVGGGVAVGWFRSNDEAVARPGECEMDPKLVAGLCPATERALLPFARAAAGVGFEAAPRLTVGVRGEYTLVFSDNTIPSVEGGIARDVRVWGDTIQIGAGADYYF